MPTNIVNQHMVDTHGYAVPEELLLDGTFAAVMTVRDSDMLRHYGLTVNESELVNTLVALGIASAQIMTHMPVLHVLSAEEASAWKEARGEDVELWDNVEQMLDPVARAAASIAAEEAAAANWDDLLS